MLSCYVTWNKEKSKTGMHKKHAKVTKSMPCKYFNQGSCLQQKSHETRGSYTNIAVLHVLQIMVTLLHTQKWIVKTKPNMGKKTSRYGWVWVQTHP